MIVIYSYNIAEGILEKPTVDKLPELLEAENVDLWIDLESPNHEESKILREVFNFHELAVEDCTQADIEEPKLDDYDDYLFIVLHSFYFTPENIELNIDELDLFFGKNYVVTYHKKPTIGIRQLRKKLEHKIDFMSEGTDEILHAIVDSLVDNYTVSFKQLERTIYKSEAEILSNPTKKTLNDLFKLKIGLINLNRIMAPGEEVMESLGETENKLIQEENKVYFQDVHDHMSKILGLLHSYTEMVNSTMYTYMSLATHRMNSVMQVMTIIATIVLVPTLIASIYGMNLKLPFQDSPNGFTIITIINLVITGSLFYYFKKKAWF